MRARRRGSPETSGWHSDDAGVACGAGPAAQLHPGTRSPSRCRPTTAWRRCTPSRRAAAASASCERHLEVAMRAASRSPRNAVRIRRGPSPRTRGRAEHSVPARGTAPRARSARTSGDPAATRRPCRPGRQSVRAATSAPPTRMRSSVVRCGYRANPAIRWSGAGSVKRAGGRAALRESTATSNRGCTYSQSVNPVPRSGPSLPNSTRAPRAGRSRPRARRPRMRSSCRQAAGSARRGRRASPAWQARAPR